MEIWLRTNPRPFLVVLVLSLLLAILSLMGLFAVSLWIESPWPVRLGWLGLAISAFLACSLIYRAYAPVLVRRGNELWLYLGGARPIAIPLEIVECFFAGQNDSLLRDRTGKEIVASTIILRIAESAAEWKHREVPARYAHWCEGYLTIRGTWCEPITPTLLRRLNQQLVAAQRAAKAEGAQRGQA